MPRESIKAINIDDATYDIIQQIVYIKQQKQVKRIKIMDVAKEAFRLLLEKEKKC